ncbi:MAG TPA: di-heme-cytochrome C peroxidase [Bryobacteraceae bacterium]|jgi:mono/diheme cytochrome c family protein
MRAALFGLLAGSLILGGCTPKPSSSTSSPSSSAPAVAWSDNGWTDAERAEYHHLAEGSELMPYDLLANLVSVKTGKPFLENMERFGFIPEAVSSWNPHGLPVGLTAARSRNGSHLGLEEVGFNCAGCHVSELTYQGKKLLIDGAPSHVDLQAYQVEFKESFEATMHDPLKLAALVVAINRALLAGNAPANEDASSYSSDPAARTAGNVTAAPTEDKSFHSKPSRQADAADPAAGLRAESPLARFRSTVALLKAQLAYVENGKLLIDGTEPGPGRVDAFGAARNLLFPKDAMKMRSPVSYPFIWDVPDTTQQRSAADAVWIHYDGNTNSILERNIGQALGMGAVFDPATYESTLRIENLHRLEVLTHKLKAPKWPADLFGSIDEAKAKTGEKIFNDNCRDCHQNRLYALTDVGTDATRANSFGQPVAGGIPFPDAIHPILDKLKARAFLDDGVSEAAQKTMDAPTVIWRATGQYMARPLTGVWATAPYLHNGSVPTLWHLLHPDQRPAKFVTGNSEYDPKNIGYTTSGSGWTFDTSQPGNGNGGHTGAKYGTDLSEDQKTALLEYLKTI